MIRKIAILLLMAFVLNRCTQWSTMTYKKRIIPSWWENREYSVINIESIYYSPEPIFNYHFNVDGKAYYKSTKYFAPRKWTKNVKYKIAYDPEDPNRHLVMMWEYNLDHVERKGFTLCRSFNEPILIHKEKMIFSVFEFQVGYANQEFITDQLVTDKNKDEFGTGVYLVEYDKSDFLHSKLMLDFKLNKDFNADYIFIHKTKPNQLKRVLNRAAKKVGDGGKIFCEMNFGKVIFGHKTTNIVKEYVTNYQPTTFFGKPIDVEIIFMEDKDKEEVIARFLGKEVLDSLKRVYD